METRSGKMSSKPTDEETIRLLDKVNAANTHFHRSVEVLESLLLTPSSDTVTILKRFDDVVKYHSEFVCVYNDTFTCIDPKDVQCKPKQRLLEDNATQLDVLRQKIEAVKKKESSAANTAVGPIHVSPPPSSTSRRMKRSKVMTVINNEMAKLQMESLEKAQQIERAREKLQRERDRVMKEYELQEKELERRQEREAMSKSLKEVDLKCQMDEVSSSYAASDKSVHNNLPSHLLNSTDKALQTSAYVEKHVSVVDTPRNPLNPRAIQFTPESTNLQPQGGDGGLRIALDAICDATTAMKVGMDTPRIEVKKFSGKYPAEYPLFIHNFKTSVANDNLSDSFRLGLLIQSCTDKAKGAIENFTMQRDKTLAYSLALNVLEDRYGRADTIVDDLIKTLTSGPKISANDGEALLDLATELHKCQLTLLNVDFESDINNPDNILKIFDRLPNHLQTKWTYKVNDICDQQRRKANFNDFVQFVNRSARVATNVYSKRLANSKSNQRKNVYAVQALEASETSETHSSKEPCAYCKHTNHVLSDCFKFAKLQPKDKRVFMYKDGRCYNCLMPGHIVRGCLSNDRCPVDGCGGRHHKLFHGLSTKYRHEKPGGEDHTVAFTNVNTVVTSKTCLRVVPVELVCGERSVLTNALLDCGSDVTLCLNELATQLGCEGEITTININTINEKNKSHNMIKFPLNIKSTVNNESIEVYEVYGIDVLPDLGTNHDVVHNCLNLSHLNDLQLPLISEGKIGILIGANVPDAFYVHDQRKGNFGEPYAIETVLGWTLMGPVKCNGTGNEANVNHVSVDTELNNQVKRFWELDFVGDSDDSLCMSKNDKVALDIISQQSKVVNGHYELPLPFKNNRELLHGNFSMAIKRLESLKRRFMRDKDLQSKYIKTLNEYIDKGWAKLVSGIDITSPSVQDLYFLPHHPVTHIRKPGKVRVVFDCAATFKGVSLNDFLFTGPDLANNLLGVLLRLRKGQIAMAADVEAMYHQVFVQPKDTKHLSFLWWPDGNVLEEPRIYQMQVHLFGARSSPACANFALRQTAKDHSAEFNEFTVKSVHDNFYVDDYLVSVDEAEEAVDLQQNVSALLQRGGFKLTKWISNRRDILKSIPEKLLAPSLGSFNLDLDDLPVAGTLGVWWNVESDTIEVSVQRESKAVTRRGILSVVSSIYDPLGICAPFCLRPKLLLQDLCRRKMNWDDPLSEEDTDAWSNWLDDLSSLENVGIPRCLFDQRPSDMTEVEIHHFCDASKFAYGAVSYLRSRNGQGEYCCRFIIGKSRMAPLKTQTIPRLELSAAVLAVKLSSIIRKHLQIEASRTVFWTDSSIVLQYINNADTRFKVFVANRLRRIADGSTPDQWRHIDTKCNVADDATRGLNSREQMNSCRWLNGPEFLRKDESEWPTPISIPGLPSCDPEVTKDVTVCAAIQTDCLMDFINHQSTFSRLVRRTSWLVRFKQHLLRNNPPKGALTTCEMQEATDMLVKFVQGVYFPFLNNLENCKLSRHMRKLRPVLKDGILRVGGRLSKAPMDFETLHPTILPNNCHLTDLIIQKEHSTHGHVGASHTWSMIRTKFWIVNGGVEVRRVTGNCIQCKRRNAKVGVQVMSDLPSCRVTPHLPPFYFTGLDFFGPILVKRARSEVKRYGCIFTCMNSRAVHLEVAESLETSAFLNVFTRFMSRRGKPKSVFSDNGTNFVGAKNVLERAVKEWNNNDFTSFMQNHGIEWNLNPPGASHMGGVWERLIRSVRSILQSILHNQTVTDDSLNTVFTEVESIMNSRPLTPVSVDVKDGEPITPNHLLNVRSHSNLPLGIFRESDVYSRNRWRQVQYVSEQFWIRWIKEYLPLMQPRQKWLDMKRNLKVGDCVLVADSRYPRRCWPVGVVHKTFPDNHGNVRQVEVKTKDALIRRPITKLCLLEATKI